MKAFKSLKPIPPSAFGMHIFSQATHAIFLSLSFWFHQKFLMREFSSLHNIFGSLKQLIVYILLLKKYNTII